MSTFRAVLQFDCIKLKSKPTRKLQNQYYLAIDTLIRLVFQAVSIDELISRSPWQKKNMLKKSRNVTSNVFWMMLPGAALATHFNDILLPASCWNVDRTLFHSNDLYEPSGDNTTRVESFILCCIQYSFCQILGPFFSSFYTTAHDVQLNGFLYLSKKCIEQYKLVHYIIFFWRSHMCI